MPVRILRVVGVATFFVAAAFTLSSCSQSGATPGDAVTPAATVVAVPSSPVPTPTEMIASNAPAPVATPVSSGAPSSSADGRKTVVPFITAADWDPSAKALDVSAIVPGVIESGGTCTVTATLGSTVRTGTSTGVGASSYTGCQAVAMKDLAAGTWQVQVRYSSAKSIGVSATKKAPVG